MDGATCTMVRQRAGNRCKLFAFLQPQYRAKQPIHFCLQLWPETPETTDNH
jgi:hypothetical protein